MNRRGSRTAPENQGGGWKVSAASASDREHDLAHGFAGFEGAVAIGDGGEGEDAVDDGGDLRAVLDEVCVSVSRYETSARTDLLSRP